MDLNILIRSMLKEKDFVYFRAGGGIVADSIPENETFETEARQWNVKSSWIINK